MRIKVFTTREPSRVWGGNGLAKALPTETIDPADLSKVIKSPEDDVFYYWDWSCAGEEAGRKALKALSKKSRLSWGVIDPNGTIKDPAEIFFAGACDFLGKALLEAGGVTAARLRKTAGFAERLRQGPVEPKAVEAREAPQEAEEDFSWETLEEGREYTFGFFFVRIGNVEFLRRKVGEARLHQLREDLSLFLASWTAEAKGHVWMTADNAILTLFPFDGLAFPGAQYGIKLLLNKDLYTLEALNLDLPLSLHVALHIGKTLYRRPGQTGGVISDAVNSIFHLGQKYAKEEAVYLTADVLPFVPDGLKGLFVQAGVYEGRNICRSKVFL